MNIKQFTFNHFMTNCYVLTDEVSKQCAIIDPSMESAHEETQIDQYIECEGLTPVAILLTHAHIDHVAGLRHACSRYNLPVSLHADGIKLLHQAEAYASVMGFDTASLNDIATHSLDDNASLTIGNSCLEARHVPGHCVGSLCYVQADDKMVFTGDALFHMSIGRTDLPGGDYDLLMEKLRTRILTLDDDYQILPGHGDLSTIREEKQCNPFLNPWQ